ncbi:MAG: type II secretion system F family protein [Lachnospiraceae bacterium]|nr:type II secretion system F family protein [Lachnospiraceae bacterium]
MQERLLNNNEISTFCRQVAFLLQAGITPAESMHIMLQDTENKDGRKIIESIYSVTSKGESFSTAINSSGVFPEYVENMISLGESSGNLDTVMASLAEYYEREELISDSIKSAVRYPILMILMMLFVIIIMMTRVLPIFAQVYEQLGTEMSGIAGTLMKVGNVLSSLSLAFLLFLAVLVVVYLYMSRTAKGKKRLTDFLERWRPTRNFYLDIARGRFAGGMAMTIASGLDTYKSLDLVATLTANRDMQEKIAECKKAIATGATFPEAITKTGIFNNLHSQIINVGFKSGSTDTAMNKIAEDYDRNNTQKINHNLAILEPILVIILSLIVGMILLSVILPLMGVMSTIG